VTRCEEEEKQAVTIETCLRASCRSPMACAAWGYCRVRNEAALAEFKAKQRALWREFFQANPGLLQEMRDAQAYDAMLRRQAFFNGQPVPQHRRG